MLKFIPEYSAHQNRNAAENRLSPRSPPPVGTIHRAPEMVFLKDPKIGLKRHQSSEVPHLTDALEILACVVAAGIAPFWHRQTPKRYLVTDPVRRGPEKDAASGSISVSHCMPLTNLPQWAFHP